MPLVGPSAPLLGYLGFCGVKPVGYTVAARAIAGTYPFKRHVPVLVGGTRTLIGMAVGAAYFFAFRALVSPAPGHSDSELGFAFSYMAGLFPIRLLEWWLLIWIFFDPDFSTMARDCRVILLGTLWSYALDLPATLGWCFTGGVGVC